MSDPRPKHLGTVKQGDYQGEWFEIEVDTRDVGEGEIPPASAIHDYARSQGLDARRWGADEGRLWIQGVRLGSLKRELEP